MKKVITLLITAGFALNASAGLVVIGHPSLDASLTESDVKRLYLGKKTKLPNGSSAQIIELAEGSEGRLAFHQLATGRSESQLQSAWSRLVFTGKAEAPVQVADYDQVIKTVAQSSNAIGYVDESKLTDDVKVLFKF